MLTLLIALALTLAACTKPTPVCTYLHLPSGTSLRGHIEEPVPPGYFLVSCRDK